MPYLPDNKFLFIHIPKNGGKYVEDRLFISDSPGRNINQTNRPILSRTGKYILNHFSKRPKRYLRGMIDYSLVGQHLTLSEISILNLVDDLNIVDIVCISRNPFSRIISLFCHHTKSNKWNNRELEDFCRYWPSHKPVTEKHNILAHKRTQYEYIDNHFLGEKEISIFKLESLDIDAIANKYKLSRRSETSILKKKGLNALNNRTIEENSKREKLKLTPQAVRCVKAYYMIDFERFGYSSDYESLN